jgi:hypothetical protein
VIHKYQVKCNVILDAIGLRNMRRGGVKAPCILNVALRSLCSQKVSPGFHLGRARGG